VGENRGAKRHGEKERCTGSLVRRWRPPDAAGAGVKKGDSWGWKMSLLRTVKKEFMDYFKGVRTEDIGENHPTGKRYAKRASCL